VRKLKKPQFIEGGSHDMKITNVKVYLQNQSRGEQKEKSWFSETIIANPLSMYPQYADRRASWNGMDHRVLVLIETDEGVNGLGYTQGGMAAATIIKQHLSQFLVGQSPFQIEKLWDIMFKATLVCLLWPFLL